MKKKALRRTNLGFGGGINDEGRMARDKGREACMHAGAPCGSLVSGMEVEATSEEAPITCTFMMKMVGWLDIEAVPRP